MGARGLGAYIAVVIGVASPVLAIDPPSTLDNVVILARTAVGMTQYIRHATGQIVVNDPGGVATLRRSVNGLAGTQFVADSIAVRGGRGRRAHGPELYDVLANTPDARIIVDGQQALLPNLPVFTTFPSTPVFVPGTNNVVVNARHGPVTLPPGDYGKITVKGGALLYFSGGTYNAKSLRASGHARLYFEGPTTLNVQDSARFGQRALLGPLVESQLNARCIVFNYAGTRPIKFAGSANITAMVVAPNAIMKLGAFGDYRGTFVAAKVLVGRSALLEAALPLTSPCQ